jgi:hypothetical protein
LAASINKNDLAISKPIVVIACMLAPAIRGSFSSTHLYGTRAGGGAVHSIIFGSDLEPPIT